MTLNINNIYIYIYCVKTHKSINGIKNELMYFLFIYGTIGY